MKDWAISHEPNDVFLETHQNRLKTISYGASFSPEMAEKLADGAGISISAREQLEIIRTQFSITDIRLGIRWNRVVNNGHIDLSYYDPVLRYALDSGMRVTLNIGPVKTFRWPEQHPPMDLLRRLEADQKLPPHYAVIEPSDPLGGEALVYADRLLSELKKTYTPNQISHITTIQPENESFHGFGEYKWRFSTSYMHALSMLIHDHVPHAGIMVNSSEFFDISQIEHYFDELMRTHPQLKDRLVSGINYYHNAPQNRHLPFVGKIDSITFAKLFGKNPYQDHIKKGEGTGFRVEVSEAMVEPWPPVMTPGNSVAEFRFVTLRAMNHLLDPDVESVIRIWGIERLAHALYSGSQTPEHGRIIELIQAVNM